MENLQDLYKNTICEKLLTEFAYKDAIQIPKITKICINIGVSDAVSEGNKAINDALSILTLISGQKPVVTKAKQSIASFKLRKGMPIGCKVTLRKKRMYDFLQRLLFITLPRVRDFRGFSSYSFDGKGNFTFGMKDQMAFPEIPYDKIDKYRGMDIVIVTSTNKDSEAKALLKAFDIPFYN